MAIAQPPRHSRPGTAGPDAAADSSRAPQTSHGSDGLFYTQDEMRELVAYAAVLGIRVVPEIDLPGHVSALAAGYPELITTAAAGGYQIERGWGV